MSLLPLFLMTCFSSDVKSVIPKTYQTHSSKTWLAKAAVKNKVSIEEQSKQDETLAKPPVPHQLKKDSDLQIEVAAIWRDQCSACHGMDGKAVAVKETEIKPRNFGTMGMSMGFFFGGDKMRAGIFRKIGNGSTKAGKELMPTYKKTLSNQQLWGLVFYIESL